jgi:hypothetical protein
MDEIRRTWIVQIGRNEKASLELCIISSFLPQDILCWADTDQVPLQTNKHDNSPPSVTEGKSPPSWRTKLWQKAAGRVASPVGSLHLHAQRPGIIPLFPLPCGKWEGLRDNSFSWWPSQHSGKNLLQIPPAVPTISGVSLWAHIRLVLRKEGKGIFPHAW